MPYSCARTVRILGGLLACAFLSHPTSSFGQPPDKLDPILKRLSVSSSLPYSSVNNLAKPAGNDHTIDVFVMTTGDFTSFATDGVVVKTAGSSVVIASVPLSRLAELASEQQVQSLHAAKIWKPLLDSSVAETGAEIVRSHYEATGKGVIIGVIDTGIDWDHPAFRDPNDTTKTRIKYLWDMSDATGPPPSGEFASSGGTEYTEADLNGGLAGSVSVRATDTIGHGTHVAGIAAGSGGGGRYVGVAPEADLIIVKASRSGDSFESTDVVTALAYIDSRAASLHKPYVANLSLGGQQGPHDGGSPEASAIDEIVGPGIDGKVVVTAAGNEGNDGIHTTGTLNNLSVLDEERSFSANAGTAVGIDIWTEVNPANQNSVFITVVGPDTLFGPVSGFPLGGSANHSDGNITIFSSPFPPSAANTGINTDVSITTKKAGEWKIRIRGAKGSGSGRFDMWIYTGNADFVTADADTVVHVGTPGAAKNAITVGAYVSKATWTDDNSVPHTAAANGLAVVLGDEALFSSPGPTRDGRQKPEIAAPGQIIASARSADAVSGASIFQSSSILEGGSYAMSQGTSMATPHVSGVVALLFQESVKRGMAFDGIEVREALQNSARTDVFTGAVPNNRWGYGKMDADSLFALLLGPPVPTRSTETVQNDTSSIAFQTPDGSETTIAFQYGAVNGHTVTYEHLGRDLPSTVKGDTPPSFPLQYFDIQTTIPDTITFEATVTVAYTPSLLTIADNPAESTLFLFHFDEADSSWRMLDTTVDTVANTATATISSFSVFSLASVTPTSIVEEVSTPVLKPPGSYALDQNFPNPFNPATTIRYDVPKQSHVKLIIYNIAGQHVRTLVDVSQTAGRYSVHWNGRNGVGEMVTSGVYVYRLSTGTYQASRRMLLLK